MHLLLISLFEIKLHSFFIIIIIIHIHWKLKEKRKFKHYDITDDLFTELFRVCLQSAILAAVAVRVRVSVLTWISLLSPQSSSRVPYEFPKTLVHRNNAPNVRIHAVSHSIHSLLISKLKARWPGPKPSTITIHHSPNKNWLWFLKYVLLCFWEEIARAWPRSTN